MQKLNTTSVSSAHRKRGYRVGSLFTARLPVFSHVGNVPNDTGGRRVFQGISLSSRPCIPALLHTNLASPSSALETSMLRTTQISSPTHSRVVPASRRTCSYSRLNLSVDLQELYQRREERVVTRAQLARGGRISWKSNFSKASEKCEVPTLRLVDGFSRGTPVPPQLHSVAPPFPTPLRSFEAMILLTNRPPTEAIRGRLQQGSLRTFARGKHSRRCRCRVGFLRGAPVSPLPPIILLLRSFACQLLRICLRLRSTFI
ncbi:hypothetical protein PR048_030331 [Dryococelus australis]|uniref:Uncharacterized protein n=1 Tax=Dryococelus australis TaxID=614101 RepID=A0ABQ9G8P6_9NEOP|nr:hypothetical protein PR048_030331 [Dryococelus australis]